MRLSLIDLTSVFNEITSKCYMNIVSFLRLECYVKFQLRLVYIKI